MAVFLWAVNLKGGVRGSEVQLAPQRGLDRVFLFILEKIKKEYAGVAGGWWVRGGYLVATSGIERARADSGEIDIVGAGFFLADSTQPEFTCSSGLSMVGPGLMACCAGHPAGYAARGRSSVSPLSGLLRSPSSGPDSN